jgi:hypothetical protein
VDSTHHTRRIPIHEKQAPWLVDALKIHFNYWLCVAGSRETVPSKPERPMKVRRTYKYRLYTSKRDKDLHQQIDVAGIIWNHALAVQKRTYRLTGKNILNGR